MKRKLWTVVVLCLALALVLVACKPAVKEYTLKLYDNDGTTLLHTITVKEGEKPQKPTDPTKDGYTFKGWFITPTNAKEFSFDDVMTKDMSAYAQWARADYQDSRDWVLVGSGVGWTADDAVHFTKVEGKGNVYTLTIDINLGDEFKCTVLNANGILDYNNATGANVGHSLVENGGENFIAGSGLGDSPKNILCGIAGNYTLTLTTDEVNANNKLAWVRNGDVIGSGDVEEAVMTYYIKGEKVTNWKDFVNSGTTMKQSADSKDTYMLEIYLSASDNFMFASQKTENGETTVGSVYVKYVNLDETSKALFTDNYGNICATEGGMYTFTYNSTTSTLSATVDTSYVLPDADYYLDGTFDPEMTDWNGYCFNEKFKLVQDAENPHIYTIEHVHLVADKEFTIQAFKKGSTERGEWGTPSYNGLGNYQFKHVFNAGENFSAVSTSNNNIKILKTSDYKITFNKLANMVTIEDENIPDDACLHGQFSGATGWADADKFVYDEEAKTYTLTKTFAEGDTFGIKILVGNTSVQRAWVGASAVIGEHAGFTTEGNITCTAAGSYTIVVDMSGETPSVTITAAE